MTKKTPHRLYVVRNLSGQRLGCYRAASEEMAIRRHIDDQRVVASSFRRSFRLRPQDTSVASYVAELQEVAS